MHVVRVLLPPPEVNDPTLHVEHEPDFAALYSVSAPQFVHTLEPVNEYLPAAHSPFALVPTHVWPGGHWVHVARFFPSAPPPAVNDPVPQVLHVEDPAAEKRLSALHFEQLLAPPDAYVPARHLVRVEPPLHEYPLGQVEHAVWPFPEAEPPLV